MADDNTQATGANTPAGEGTTQTGAAAQSGAERTYTQAEVDELLTGYVPQERVDEMVSARDKALADVQRLTASAAHRDLVDKVSAATGVPGSLLKGETEDELTASAEAVKAYAGAQAPAYPEDKGGGANPSPITRDQIESIKDPVERVRTRAQHIDLYN